jgi:hypothetical protein
MTMRLLIWGGARRSVRTHRFHYLDADGGTACKILGGRQSKRRSNRLGVLEAGGHIDGDAIGQRHHGTNTGDRHQAPTHIIFANDGQQAAVQDVDLFAKRPPRDEQRFDQHGQIGEVLDAGSSWGVMRYHLTAFERAVMEEHHPWGTFEVGLGS